MVSANLDIRGNQIDDRRIRATEQNDLGSPLQIIVHDMKGAGTVPAGDGLSLVARTGEAGDLRINNGSFGAIERKASPRSIQSGGMNVTTIKYQVMRELRQRCVIALSEIDQVIDIFRGWRRRKLDAHKLVVMGLQCCDDCRLVIWCGYLGHRPRVLSRADPFAFSRDTRQVRCSYRNVVTVIARPGSFIAQEQRTNKSGANLNHNGVAVLGIVDSRLQVIACSDGDCAWRSHNAARSLSTSHHQAQCEAEGDNRQVG